MTAQTGVEAPTQDFAALTTQPAAVTVTAGLYRVVLDRRSTGTAAASMAMHRRAMLEAFDAAVAVFATDIAAGELRVSVLTEHVWAARSTARGAVR